MRKEGFFGVAAALWLCAAGNDININAATNISHRFDPVRRSFSPDQLQFLKVPPGFRINIFAPDQHNARMMLLLPDGSILLSRFDVGELVRLRDTNSDGVADESTVITTIPGLHGLALRDSTVYLASETKLLTMALNGNGSLGPPKAFAQLPPGGLHPRRTLGFDDAGWLYVSVGSDCNNCYEGDPELATILRMKPDGSERTIFARGLRNTIGFDWHPVTRQLWGWDNGSDDRGDNLPPEELNLLEEGKHYGWPSCYGRRVTDRIAAQDPLIDPFNCAASTPLVRGYRAHSAPIAFVFYHGTQFPPAFQHDGFVCLHGSWNRLIPSGYKVVRVRFAHGRPTGFQDFVSGFLIENGKAYFGRPAGLVVTQDGSLLISDDHNGAIYRVSYAGRQPGAAR